MNPTPIARRLSLIAAAAAASVLVQSAPAFAQEEDAAEPDAAEAADAEAAEAEPAPAPANAGSCGAARCFGVELAADLQENLSGEGAPLDALISGLALAYEGEAPTRSYFVAARYDDDRLVRYDVSDAFMMEAGASPEDLAEVVTHAFGPRTENGLAVLELDAETAPATSSPPADVFVGSMPPNTMVAILEPGREEAPDVDERMEMGSVGVLALIPADAELRAGPEGAMQVLAVRLDYAD